MHRLLWNSSYSANDEADDYKNGRVETVAAPAATVLVIAIVTVLAMEVDLIVVTVAAIISVTFNLFFLWQVLQCY